MTEGVKGFGLNCHEDFWPEIGKTPQRFLSNLFSLFISVVLRQRSLKNPMVLLKRGDSLDLIASSRTF